MAPLGHTWLVGGPGSKQLRCARHGNVSMARPPALRVSLIACIVLHLLISLRLTEAFACPSANIDYATAEQATTRIYRLGYHTNFGATVSAGNGAVKVSVGATAAFDGLLELVNETVDASLYVQTAPLFRIAADVLNSVPQSPTELLPVCYMQRRL